jgi:phytanoyl-CoA hydroxylase
MDPTFVRVSTHASVAQFIPSGTSLGQQLTLEQREFFHENGFLHFPAFLDRSMVNEVLKAIGEIQDRWITEGRELVNGIPIKYGRDVDGRKIVQRFAFANQHHPVLADLLRDQRFNALLELVGTNARLGTDEKDGLVVNHYVNTDTSNFTQMGWHTDSLRDLFLGKKIMPMLNVGIHLDDQHPENGGLRLIPGTHTQGLWNMIFRKRYFKDTAPDKDEVGFAIKAGDLTIHDGRLWHRVQRSALVGDASRRRVMYIPVVCGKYSPKTAESPTPIYHKFQHLVR